MGWKKLSRTGEVMLSFPNWHRCALLDLDQELPSMVGEMRKVQMAPLFSLMAPGTETEGLWHLPRGLFRPLRRWHAGPRLGCRRDSGWDAAVGRPHGVETRPTWATGLLGLCRLDSTLQIIPNPCTVVQGEHKGVRGGMPSGRAHGEGSRLPAAGEGVSASRASGFDPRAHGSWFRV